MADSTRPDPRAQWWLHLGRFHCYSLVRSKLFESRRGSWTRILSFCIDDPDQGPVVVLPIMQQKGLD
jgi:hypothetical protein